MQTVSGNPRGPADVDPGSRLQSTWFLLILLALSQAAETEGQCPGWPPPPMPLPGVALLRADPRVVNVGQQFPPGNRLLFEFHVPIQIPGQGLPNPPVDESIVQLELPVQATGTSDPADLGVAAFSAPRFCDVADPTDPADTPLPCLNQYAGQPGYWRAIILRPGACPRELQLAFTFQYELDPWALYNPIRG